MVETATNGVRSGITPQDTEDVQSHPTGSVVTHRAVRMSLRPPARFTEKADFALWIKRFERYVLEAKISDEERTSELLPLLEDEPFRIVVQQGLADSTDYDEVVQCLRRQYDPEGNELESQCRFQQRVQSSGEKLMEFVGALRFLADKAYPQWNGEQRLEVVRRQFIQGLRSSSMQLKLMRENPESLDEAVRLACQWEMIEAAQRTLQKERIAVAEALELSERDRNTMALAAQRTKGPSGRGAEDISKQLDESEKEIKRLSELTDKLRKELGNLHVGEPQPFRGQGRRRIVCWTCGQAGHTKRFCTRRKKQSPAGTAAVSSALIVNGCISGRKTPMLVDTGSGVTLVGEKVWKELGSSPNGSAPLEEPARAVVVANGETLDVVGQVELLIELGGLAKKHMVLVARQLTHDCLLGADFLCQHNCIIDLQHRVLLAGDQTVTMCASDSNNGGDIQLCFVSLLETTVIPASCLIRLPVTVHRGDTTVSCDVIMEPLSKFNDQHSLLVAHSLTKANSDHTIVEILNLNSGPVTVHKNEKVGVLKPVVDVCEWREAGKNVMNHRPRTARSRDMKWAEKMLAGAQDLSTTQKDAAMSLLAEFESSFAENNDDFGRTSLVYHGIDTQGATPIRQQPRRLPYHRRDEVRKLLDSMLSRGVIEPSSSPWAAPIVLAKKRDGSTRFCVDFRKLNDVTRKDAQPLPRIDDTLDALGQARYFSTLDLASGYWQVEVKPEDKEKTAFVIPHGLFQFRVMPFGLCNAPATFQRLMEHVLAGLHWSTCLVYLDDIIVFSTTAEEHLERLRAVCLRLKYAGLKMKPSKCHLFQSSVKYLGHVVCKEGIKTDPDKIQCVADWPVPNDVRKLKCFYRSMEAMGAKPQQFFRYRGRPIEG